MGHLALVIFRTWQLDGLKLMPHILERKSVVARSVRSSDWKSLIVCLNWSQSAFLERGMLHGTCLVWLGMVFTSTRTMSWSLRPGKIDTLSIRVGLEVKMGSKMGEVTVCSRRQSLKTSRHSL